MSLPEFWNFFLRMMAAALCGSLIGLEREYNKKPAGLRTLILICSGSALLVSISIDFAKLAAGGNGDPSRIAAQIVTGIGFLGAGAILHERGSVLGLTTASTIWSVAGIGMACGAGWYVEAISFTLLVISVLTSVKPIEHWISRRCHVNEYVITVKKLKKVMPLVQEAISKSHIWHQSPMLQVVKMPDHQEIRFSICQSAAGHKRFERAITDHAESFDIRRG